MSLVEGLSLGPINFFRYFETKKINKIAVKIIIHSGAFMVLKYDLLSKIEK